MEFGNIAFWLFLAATTVASLTFITIVVWAENRVKERQEFYRFEFRKRLVDAGKMDAGSLAALMRYEHELRMQQVRLGQLQKYLPTLQLKKACRSARTSRW